MVGTQIVSNANAWASVEASLWGGVESYCAFNPQRIHGAIPTAASADHDGRIGTLVRSMLSSYLELMCSDVETTRRMHAAFQSTDEGMAASFGVGAGR